MNRVTKALLFTYFIILCWILLFKFGVYFSYMENRSVNIVPFSAIFLHDAKVDLPEIILNILIFIPPGIYVGALYKRWSFIKKLLFFFFASFVFESVQFIFRIGAFDVTDIITNTTGGVTGLMLFAVTEKIFGNAIKAQRLVNVIGVIATIAMIVLLALLKMNMLPIKYQ